jgi:hypothetical protein
MGNAEGCRRKSQQEKQLIRCIAPALVTHTRSGHPLPAFGFVALRLRLLHTHAQTPPGVDCQCLPEESLCCQKVALAAKQTLVRTFQYGEKVIDKTREDGSCNRVAYSSTL